MGTDAAKHVIPAGSDGARRQTLLDLIASAHDVIPVANATERATVLAGLVAAGRNPAIAPVYVDQLDVGLVLRNVTTSDANWATIANDSTAWTTPTLVNGWLVYSNPPYESPAYRKLNGVVYLAGFIKSGSTGTIFTLPAGFRPTKVATFVVASGTGSAVVAVNSTTLPADGQVQVAAYGSGGSNANVSLRGISFPAEV
ncbi:MAG: hypothetical protein J0I40_13180 [Cellulomonas sp.]|uniref:hypothetical protein n=1 Tax=Cellulomonas sp. 73-92 TaxID=1895740 RepID=UPI00092A2DF8|nr:hypothetical protein [Cellulomonas sp. 73-92]MBN9376314.1 hypothetical protein [Cellulomonas sp.]OJV76514.1 MAG: hypothetical protein BGO37_10680 [Cellulomonas sp. 73-92]